MMSATHEIVKDFGKFLLGAVIFVVYLCLCCASCLLCFGAGLFCLAAASAGEWSSALARGALSLVGFVAICFLIWTACIDD